jgi:hypothetical protein
VFVSVILWQCVLQCVVGCVVGGFSCSSVSVGWVCVRTGVIRVCELRVDECCSVLCTRRMGQVIVWPTWLSDQFVVVGNAICAFRRVIDSFIYRLCIVMWVCSTRLSDVSIAMFCESFSFEVVAVLWYRFLLGDLLSPSISVNAILICLFIS